MRVSVDEVAVSSVHPPAPVGRAGTRDRFPARSWAVAWPATGQGREEVLGRLTRPPFVLSSTGSQKQRRRGLELLVDWLMEQPGQSWQQRWLASGADAAGSRWRQVPGQWLQERGGYSDG